MAVSHFCRWLVEIRHQKELSVSCQSEIAANMTTGTQHSGTAARDSSIMNSLSVLVLIFVTGSCVNKFSMTNRHWKIDEDFD